MTDAMKTIEDSLNAIREEARQAGFVAGYDQGFDKGFAAAIARLRELVDEVKPPVRPGAPRIGDLFADAAGPTDRKRGQNNDTILTALKRAEKPIGASDLRRVIEMMDGVSIPYSSIRHSLMGLERSGLVTVENDLWSLVEKELEPI
jgi:DNA-binding transcriptional ArsR family regulator